MNIKQIIKAESWSAAYALDGQDKPVWFTQELIGWGLTDDGQVCGLVADKEVCDAAGWVSIYMTTASLLDALRATFDEKAEASFGERWHLLSEARILILDEADRYNPTAWAEEKFFELVDLRYQHGDRMLTGFAINADIRSLPGYLVSRIEDHRCKVFRLTGGDQRKVER